jgi:4'-phosphopantetheinyl transferase
VRSLPPQEQQKVFFRYWTCKEAYLKATGVGLTQLEQVEVFLSPKEPARLNHQQWSLIELVPASNYVAAAAVAGTNINLQCWEYQ